METSTVDLHWWALFLKKQPLKVPGNCPKLYTTDGEILIQECLWNLGKNSGSLWHSGHNPCPYLPSSSRGQKLYGLEDGAIYPPCSQSGATVWPWERQAAGTSQFTILCCRKSTSGSRGQEDWVSHCCVKTPPRRGQAKNTGSWQPLSQIDCRAEVPLKKKKTKKSRGCHPHPVTTRRPGCNSGRSGPPWPSFQCSGVVVFPGDRQNS